MSVKIKCLSILALGLAACGHAGPANGGEANPFMVAEKKDGPRPLAPNRLYFAQVDFNAADDDGKRIYIRIDDDISDSWDDLFRNLAFASDSITQTLELGFGVQNFPEFMPSSSEARVGSVETLIARMQILTGTREPEKPRFENGKRISGVNNLSGHGKITAGSPKAYMFLFPKRADYERAQSGLNSARIKGLDKFSAINSDCAYARISREGGDAQAAIMLMHMRDDLVDLNDPGDRRCMLGFFARNWNISIETAHRMVFGDVPIPQGICEYVRMMERGEHRAFPPVEKAGCPRPNTSYKPTGGVADHQPEAVVAYVRRKGVGLLPAQADMAIEAMRKLCATWVNNELPDFKASCRSAFEGF